MLYIAFFSPPVFVFRHSVTSVHMRAHALLQDILPLNDRSEN